MEKALMKYNGFTIKRKDTNTQINFVVSDKTGILFRLVPTLEGFELSPYDKSKDNIPDEKLIAEISDFILQQDA